MSDPTELQIFAEIAITLAGLTGIIGALQQRKDHPLSNREKVHLIILLVSAVFVVVFAFVPHWLSRHPSIGPEVWLWSTRALLAAHLITWVIFLHVSKGGRVISQELPQIERNIALLFYPCGIAACIAEVVIAMGQFESFAPFVYEAVLMLFMVLGLYNFVSLLLGAYLQDEKGSAAQLD